MDCVAAAGGREGELSDDGAAARLISGCSFCFWKTIRGSSYEREHSVSSFNQNRCAHCPD